MLTSIGGLLGVLAARTLRSSRGATPKPTILDRLQGASTATFLGAGAIGMITNLSTLVLFIPAFRMITKSSAGTAAEVVAFAVLLGITLLPVIAPALLVTLLGDRANGVLGRMNRFMTGHSAQITVGIEVVFALLLLAKTDPSSPRRSSSSTPPVPWCRAAGRSPPSARCPRPWCDRLGPVDTRWSSCSPATGSDRPPMPG